jgi:hypothetical protein
MPPVPTIEEAALVVGGGARLSGCAGRIPLEGAPGVLEALAEGATRRIISAGRGRANS